MKYLKTRKKLAAVIVLAIILVIAVPVALAQFGDVPAGHWAETQIDWAADAHITAGCGGGNFCPDANVTRAQMAVFMSNLFHAWSNTLDEAILDIDQQTIANNPPAIVARANDGHGVAGYSYGAGIADNGVYGETNSSDGGEAGVYGRSTDNAAGVVGRSTDGIGVVGSSTNSWGGHLVGAATGGNPDLVLGGTAAQDDGIVWTEPGLSGSDMMFYSNDEYWINLDEDNNETSSFTVFNGANVQQFRVDETSGWYGDWTDQDRDTIIRTRDNLDIHLDDTNDGINGVLWVRDELDNVVFWVNNFGDARLDDDMTIVGDLTVLGAKSAVQETSEGTRALYAIESPENWFEDFGGGQLVDGQATVAIEPLFLETVNTGVDYRVFVTPLGDCKGLYVANKTPTSFEVHELGGGKANIAFDFRIVAKRSGFEELRLEPADVTDYDGQANPAPAVDMDDELPIPGQSFSPERPPNDAIEEKGE